MSELANIVLMILSPILDGLNQFLTFFIRDDLMILGYPYYKWVIFFFVIGGILAIVVNAMED